LKLLWALISLSLVTILTVCLGQGCTPTTRFTEGSLPLASKASGGNGSSYDGKPLVLHHYVDDFKCEGKARPESILIRNEKLNWVLIRNTAQKCGFINRDPATGVIYYPDTNQAQFNGATYVRPKDYFVIATEPPNLPAVAIDTGVCEDSNGVCSLRAAIDQSGFTSITTPLIIHVPKAVYNLTSMLRLVSASMDGQLITIQGAGIGSTILDGGNSMSLLNVERASPVPVVVSDITFQNGLVGLQGLSAAALLDVRSCEFKNNSSIGLTSQRPTSIQKSIFANNTIGISAIANPYLHVEDTTVTGSASIAIEAYQCARVDLQRSTIYNNHGVGIQSDRNQMTRLDNITVTGNGGGGMYGGDGTGPGGNTLSIKNSTFSKNTPAGNGFSNLAVSPWTAPDTITIANTIFETADPSMKNCGIDPRAIVTVQNNLADDATCPVGPGTIVAPVQLGPLANNGGFTLTMQPLLSSPAIDAGANAMCSATDQIGNPRPVGKVGPAAVCDIGAVEVQ
jgi:hypothetical protein